NGQRASGATAEFGVTTNAPAPVTESTMRDGAKTDAFARKGEELDEKERAKQPDAEAPVQVRSDFRSTVLWQPDVVTGPDGTATVKISFPDSLTSWRATARAATTGHEFGIATSQARTRKPLTV